MRRDDQIGATITGTFAVVFGAPDGAFVYSVLFPSYTPNSPGTIWLFALLGIVVVGGIGIGTVMTRPRIGALWYMGWSIVLLLQLIVMRLAGLVILAGVPAVILLIAATLAWRASRQPSSTAEQAMGRLRDDS